MFCNGFAIFTHQNFPAFGIIVSLNACGLCKRVKILAVCMPLPICCSIIIAK